MLGRYKLPLIGLALFGAFQLYQELFGGNTAEKPAAAKIESRGDSVAAARAEKAICGRVTKVSDGDTIWVTAGGERTKVRLDRIDAPEKDQAFGKQATAYLQNLIGGKDVEVRYSKCDRYGRVLGIVWFNGEDVNLRLVREGMAWHYDHYDKTPAYIAAQQSAQSAKRGLWASPNPVNPYIWRKSR